MVASFSLDGAFLGLTDVDSEIVLCRERPSRLQSARRVGVLYQIQVCTHIKIYHSWRVFKIMTEDKLFIFDGHGIGKTGEFCDH